MPKNLGVWRGWKLGECFSGDMETSGWLFARVGTWHSCTLETFSVQSWYSETSVAFVRLVKLRARSVVASCRSVVVLGCSVVGVFVLLFRISGNSMAFVVLSELLF